MIQISDSGAGSLSDRKFLSAGFGRASMGSGSPHSMVKYTNF
jgi:hypothetical protein